MLALRPTLIVCVLLALILTVCSHDHQKKFHKRETIVVSGSVAAVDSWLCQYSTTIAAWLGVNCNNPTTPAPPSSQGSNGQSSTMSTPTTSTAVSSTASNSTPTPLERITWCRLSNGSFLQYGQIYMSGLCTICQCTATRYIRCVPFQCMPADCIDNSSPTTKNGQCCSQCNSDPPAISCTYQGVPYPHGVILRSDNTMKCWCQMGLVECRNGVGSVFGSLDLWGDGTAVYIVLIVLGVVLLIGTLLCCGCTVFFYYYYQRHQQDFQQVYDQYYNNSAGWQPMAEQDGLTDVNGEDKQTELEQGQFESEKYLSETNNVNTPPGQIHMPPPYALYNGAYVSEEQHNNQKKL
jgi:hypothetical protein